MVGGAITSDLSWRWIFLNTILLISAIVAFAAAALWFVLIRERDFVTPVESETGPATRARPRSRSPPER